MKLNTFIRKKYTKKAQFNFVWLFAIVAGGAILALAIYGAMNAGETYPFISNTQAAKSISIITDPLQSGFSESSFGKISFQQESRINNFCSAVNFGTNEISVSTKSGNENEWSQTGAGTLIHNKYIFSSDKDSGKNYYVFSKSFKFPYEVSDLIFLTPENYCFINAPEEISEEIEDLNPDNIRIENCSPNEIRVCFDQGSNCDITVYGSCFSGCDSTFDSGKVVKGSQEMIYIEDLMYAAIFSDKEIYECNIKRLMYRNSKLAKIFSEKVDLMNIRDCESNLKTDLIIWSELTSGSSSQDLISLKAASESLDKKNNGELCGLW